MSLLVVGSLRGVPGVTTTSLLLAGFLPNGAAVEADLDGGVLAVRYRLGREPGLTTLAGAGVDGPGEWRQHAQDAGGVPVLVGPDMPERMTALWARAGDDLAGALTFGDDFVVADAGRLRPGEAHQRLLSNADLLLLLVRPVPEHLVALAHRLPTLYRQVDEVGVILVGPGPYGADDIRTQVGAEVLGTLPDDRRSAQLLSNGGGSSRRLARLPLARAARTLADTLAARFAPATDAGPDLDEVEQAGRDGEATEGGTRTNRLAPATTERTTDEGATP